jgi:DNA repair protein RecO (recombination protein O)
VIQDSGTGFVLRTWPLRESDLIVSVFTVEHGKIRGVARAARRPKSRWLGALDPMTEIDLEWRSREGEELLNLTDCSIVRSPYHVAQDLGVTWTLAFVSELVEVTAPAQDPDETVYRLLRSAVEALLAGTSHQVVARYVTAWILRLHGVLPDSLACAGCGRSLAAEGGQWHWRLHGVGCAACLHGESGGIALLPQDLAFLEDVRRKGPGAVPVPDARVLRRTGVFLRHLLHEMAGRTLNSERFLEELDKMEGRDADCDGP